MSREADGSHWKWKSDEHSFASVFHLMSLFLSVTALVQLPWFYVGGCAPPTLGPKYFLSLDGHFDAELSVVSPDSVRPTTSLDVSIKYHSDSNGNIHTILFILYICIKYTLLGGVYLIIEGP